MRNAEDTERQLRFLEFRTRYGEAVKTKSGSMSEGVFYACCAAADKIVEVVEADPELGCVEFEYESGFSRPKLTVTAYAQDIEGSRSYCGQWLESRSEEFSALAAKFLAAVE